MLRVLLWLTLLADASVTAGVKPAEGDEYVLMSADGRYLVADASGSRLVPASRTSGGHVFSFVPVQGSSAVYLLFHGTCAGGKCDSLLSAQPAEGQEAPDDVAQTAQWRLFTRQLDGRVSLRSHYGELLRASTDGSDELEQGGTHSDAEVWWRLELASEAPPLPSGWGSALAAASETFGAWTGAEPAPARDERKARDRKAVRRARPRKVDLKPAAGAHSASAVYAGSSLVVVGATLGLVGVPGIGSVLDGTLSGAFGGMLRDETHYETPAVIVHGLIVAAIADVVAQSIVSPGGVLIDWRRARRTAFVCFVTDDLPFLFWIRAVWSGFEAMRPVIDRLPLPPALRAFLLSPLGAAALKTAATQLVYESASTAFYLGLQEGVRGGGVRGVWREIRSKFVRAWSRGVAFFSVAHVLMFLVPFWWLQPVVDNLSTLIFNIWLARLSYLGVDDREDADEEEEGEAADGADADPFLMRSLAGSGAAAASS